MNLFYVIGFVMDYDPNHFSTLLTVCIMITILLYIILNVIEVCHQRSIKTTQHSITNDESLTTDELNDEEQQMTNYLEGVNEIE
jgi:DMSO reductase anchor subunit